MLGAVAGAALALSGCASEAAPEDTAAEWCINQPVVTWDSFGHAFVTTYCTSCHSVNNTESRYGAPVGSNFDSEADLAAQADRFRARVFDAGDMPVGGGVYEEDLALMQVYLTCTLGL